MGAGLGPTKRRAGVLQTKVPILTPLKSQAARARPKIRMTDLTLSTLRMLLARGLQKLTPQNMPKTVRSSDRQPFRMRMNTSRPSKASTPLLVCSSLFFQKTTRILSLRNSSIFFAVLHFASLRVILVFTPTHSKASPPPPLPRPRQRTSKHATTCSPPPPKKNESILDAAIPLLFAFVSLHFTIFYPTSQPTPAETENPPSRDPIFAHPCSVDASSGGSTSIRAT